MIGDTFTVNGKTYTIQNDFVFGDKKKLNRILSKNRIDPNLDTDELMDRMNNSQVEYEEFVADVMKKILGLSDNDLELMKYPDEVKEVSEQMFKAIAEPKKNLSKPSDSPTSQELQAYLK